MEAYMTRAIAERDDLHDKAKRLAAFFDTTTFGTLPQAEQVRMVRQLRHMNDYCEVLTERIEAFPQ
jgi:hypothetical protein